MLPQKALHLHLEEAKKRPKLLGDYMVSEKLDGWYVYVDRINGVWQQPHSRAGRAIPAFEKHVEDFESLRDLPKTSNLRLIAEAYIPDVDFAIANGIFNRSVGDYHCNSNLYAVHDLILLDDLRVPALERYKLLQEVSTSETNRIEIHPILSISGSKDIWLYYAKQVWEEDGEGVVLKYVDSPYLPDKRNSSLMKIKLEENFILECIDIFYTFGEKGNRNLNATFRRSNGIKQVCRIGKHIDIANIESDADYILGQKCLIVAMCELPDGQLREPRFKKIIRSKADLPTKYKE